VVDDLLGLVPENLAGQPQVALILLRKSRADLQRGQFFHRDRRARYLCKPVRVSGDFFVFPFHLIPDTNISILNSLLLRHTHIAAA
jgi:hypothetical protein